MDEKVNELGRWTHFDQAIFELEEDYMKLLLDIDIFDLANNLLKLGKKELEGTNMTNKWLEWVSKFVWNSSINQG